MLTSLAACTEKVPPVKRLLSEKPIDTCYLQESFIPAYPDAQTKGPLIQSAAELEKNLAEFQAFMHDVESGTIPAKKHTKGIWVSNFDKRDGWIMAEYSDRLGPVIDFQKHQNKDPFSLIYHFTFTRDGQLTGVETLKDTFRVDAQGRVQEYHHRKNGL